VSHVQVSRIITPSSAYIFGATYASAIHSVPRVHVSMCPYASHNHAYSFGATYPSASHNHAYSFGATYPSASHNHAYSFSISCFQLHRISKCPAHSSVSHIQVPHIIMHIRLVPHVQVPDAFKCPTHSSVSHNHAYSFGVTFERLA